MESEVVPSPMKGKAMNYFPPRLDIFKDVDVRAAYLWLKQRRKCSVCSKKSCKHIKGAVVKWEDIDLAFWDVIQIK